MIEDKKKQKQEVLKQMEDKKESYLTELSKFTYDWFEKETLSTIKSNADKVVELGADRAKKLKSEIETLKDNVSNLIMKYMDEDYLWWHTNETKTSYYSYDHRLLDIHERKIKIMFGELGNIFITYGLVKAGSKYNRHHSSGWIHDGYGDKSLVKYGYGLSYLRELLDVNKEYLGLIEKAQDINEQIEDIEDKKKRENIEDWWKSL